MAYAYLIAADRCHHVSAEIIPNLNAGRIVLSDRYVESSFVLQHYDGISYDKLWEINGGFLIPHISVLLTAEQAVIANRLNQRETFSKYEEKMTRGQELEYYLKAADYLSKKGFNFITICNNGIEDLMNGTNRLIAEVKKLLMEED